MIPVFVLQGYFKGAGPVGPAVRRGRVGTLVPRREGS